MSVITEMDELHDKVVYDLFLNIHQVSTDVHLTTKLVDDGFVVHHFPNALSKHEVLLSKKFDQCVVYITITKQTIKVLTERKNNDSLITKTTERTVPNMKILLK